jgi:LysM repeat protein
MTQRGEQFGEGPQACPFIALELDRDRRSDKPDSRQRCFAEPTPQPRALAHQEQYCLSPNFAQCPIFQGWAMRAAARPVPVPQGYEGRARSAEQAGPVPPAGSAGASTASTPPASTQSPLPADVLPVAPAAGEAWPADAFAPPADQDGLPNQISAFEVASSTVPAGGPGFAPSEPSFAPSPSAAEQDQAGPQSTTAWSSISASSTSGGSRGPDDAPVPGFLAGRPERPAPSPGPRASGAPLSGSQTSAGQPSASKPGAAYREQVSREDLVPSWDLTDKYGADVTDRRSGRDPDEIGGGGGDRFGGIVTAVAVIAILALGVLGVIFLPGLLAGHGATATATPTQFAVVPTDSGLATFAPVPTDTPLPTAVPKDTPTPAPSATPRTYKVKSGDQLGQIAHRFGVSVNEIMAANPAVTNPDDIFVGEVLVIPQPAATEVPSASP